MSMIPPINADARSSVEIEDSCNCCVGRRRPVHRKPQREAIQYDDPISLKVRSASVPVIKQTSEEEWEIMIDTRKVSTEPSLTASVANISLKDIPK